MTRRALLALAFGAVLDPDRLLWRPGQRLISVPKPRPMTLFVKSSGSDQNSGENYKAPLKTFSRAITLAPPGGTIWLMD